MHLNLSTMGLPLFWFSTDGVSLTCHNLVFVFSLCECRDHQVLPDPLLVFKAMASHPTSRSNRVHSSAFNLLQFWVHKTCSIVSLSLSMWWKRGEERWSLVFANVNVFAAKNFLTNLIFFKNLSVEQWGVSQNNRNASFLQTNLILLTLLYSSCQNYSCFKS